MSAQTIDQPFVSSTSLRSVNFFNGRLLTGDDLRREQATQEARLQRLGRIAGSGVAEGFEVVETLGTSSNSRPVVTVSAGLALSRSGVALELPADVDVALYREDAPSDAEPGGLFADCQPFAPGTYTAGAGVYLLTVGPAEQGEGRAQVSGLGNDAAPCNVALSAEALRFRLIRLALEHAELVDKARLRNRVAYACFGAESLAGTAANPFGPPVTSYGLLDTLRTETLTDDEVPLATIGWSIDDGIQFVDLWSVRRGVTPQPGEGDWSSFVAARRRRRGRGDVPPVPRAARGPPARRRPRGREGEGPLRAPASDRAAAARRVAVGRVRLRHVLRLGHDHGPRVHGGREARGARPRVAELSADRPCERGGRPAVPRPRERAGARRTTNAASSSRTATCRIAATRSSTSPTGTSPTTRRRTAEAREEHADDNQRSEGQPGRPDRSVVLEPGRRHARVAAEPDRRDRGRRRPRRARSR